MSSPVKSRSMFIRRRLSPTKKAGEEGATLLLPAFQRPGETAEDWLPTDALGYYVLDAAVLKGEVVDDSGLRQDIEGGHWVLTSPNDASLVLPAMGLRSPRRYRDGHFGYDDFSRWPQFFTRDFEHHAFVPRYSEELARLWWVPVRDECAVIPGAVDRDVRVLNPSIVDEFKAHCDHYCSAVADALKYHQEDRALLWVTNMCDTLDRLSLGLSFRSITQEVGEFQRSCLEIHGWLNLITTFHPRSLRQSLDDNTCHPIDKSIMGAFTHEVAVAQRLYRIGAPVYLIRHSSSLPPNMNVKESCPTSPRRVTLTPNTPPVVTDDYTTERKGPYPFPTLPSNLPGSRLQESLQRIRISVSGGERATAIGATEEKRREGGGEQLNDAVSFRTKNLIAYRLSKKPVPLSSLLSSAIDPSLFNVQTIPSWEVAVRECCRKPYLPGVSSNVKGTPLPSPSIFKASKNQRLYIASWLAIRPVHMDNVLEALERPNPVFPTGQQWRNFLYGIKHHFDPPAASSSNKRASTSTSSSDPSSKRQRLESTSSDAHPAPRAEASKKREGQDLLNSLPLRQQRLTQLCWVDKMVAFTNQEELLRGISDDMVSEVVWDLHEQNFRIELFMLDIILLPGVWRFGDLERPDTQDARYARENMIRDVLPSSGSFYVKEMPNEDGGISSRSWVERGRHFRAFRKLMLDWPYCPNTVKDAPLTMDEHSVAVLENVVIREYCFRILQHFGRPPTTPVRLPFASLRRTRPASFYAGVFSQRGA